MLVVVKRFVACALRQKAYFFCMEEAELNKLFGRIILDNFRAMARVRALECIIQQNMTEAQQESMHTALNKHYNYVLQEMLSDIETKNPALAAILDKRTPKELTDLEL